MLKKLVAIAAIAGAVLALAGCQSPEEGSAPPPPAAGSGGGGAPTGDAKVGGNGPAMNPGQLPPPPGFTGGGGTGK